MRSRPNPLYRLIDKDYHENFDAYMPQKTDFCDLVSAGLPAGWGIQRNGIWFHCGSPQNAVPQQGWKIHISATPANARELLQRVTSVLFDRRDTDFKFALDMSTLFLLNSKNWSRGRSGKFITIYPRDNGHFLDLIEQLHRVTAGERGPYILSDHRYKDSNVLFFRFGGMRLYDVLNVKGERTPMLVAPDGSEIPDQRTAYPVTPSWENPPLPIDDPAAQQEFQGMKGGRYKIQDVLDFSNAGGVYRAIDQQTGKKVVIKEARPCINSTFDGYDAVELLKKEYRLLTVLKDTGIAPQPVDLFKEWEHWFLVEEYIEGDSMGAHSAQHNVLFRTRPRAEQYEEWYATFRSVCISLAKIMDVLHAHQIVFADLSINNLIVLTGKTELKLIDFEGAIQIGVDRPSSVFTPGFVSENRLAGSNAAYADDYYSVGAVLLAYLFPINSLFHLRPKAKREIITTIQRDARFPQGIADLLLNLMDQDPERRPLPARMLEVLASAPVIEPQTVPLPVEQNYEPLLAGIVSHIEQAATYSRHDRLFPADPKIFVTNPLSLAYGAAGVGYALKQITGAHSEPLLSWILRHKITPQTYAPGLYVGTSGIALSLLEMGAVKEAEDLFQQTFHHRLLHAAPGIFYGTAGWGMTNLHFFLQTGDQLYLDKATSAGNHLLETCHLAPAGCFWNTPNETPLGFADGASGIAVFLLYLYLATRNESFLEAGRRGLEFDLSFAVTTKDGGLSWRQATQGQSPLFPYWRFGSAGIGTAVLRFARLLGTEHYQSVLEKIFIDTDRKYVVLPGKFIGLAGIGDFMLDMHQLTGEARYLDSARKAAEGIRQFRVERQQGIAFPGDMLSRLCCDYGTGSAGIGLFLNRLLHQCTNDFMLDSLFEQSGLLTSSREEKASIPA
ncbi:MAG TPA: class III lanthionine synthetase LanKC [Candidatus Angelobacter sp.]|nr:class III lanthionine synthetase LanKC [Candidatus Angelobacter sp.]